MPRLWGEAASAGLWLVALVAFAACSVHVARQGVGGITLLDKGDMALFKGQFGVLRVAVLLRRQPSTAPWPCACQCACACLRVVRLEKTLCGCSRPRGLPRRRRFFTARGDAQGARFTQPRGSEANPDASRALTAGYGWPSQRCGVSLCLLWLSSVGCLLNACVCGVAFCAG